MLVEEGAHYIKSDAILRIATRLALPLPVVAAALMPLPYFIKDTFYDQVRQKKRCAAVRRMLGSAVPSLMQVLLRLPLALRRSQATATASSARLTPAGCLQTAFRTGSWARELRQVLSLVCWMCKLSRKIGNPPFGPTLRRLTAAAKPGLRPTHSSQP